VDAIDTVSSASWTSSKPATQYGVPFVCSLGMGNRLDPSRVQLYRSLAKTSGDPLARSGAGHGKKAGHGLSGPGAVQQR
jgi:tRNA A37 threonylcarbamoyladenosine dehydratase